MPDPCLQPGLATPDCQQTAVVVAPAVLPHGQRGLHDYGLPGGCRSFGRGPGFGIGWHSCLLSSTRFWV